MNPRPSDYEPDELTKLLHPARKFYSKQLALRKQQPGNPQSGISSNNTFAVQFVVIGSILAVLLAAQVGAACYIYHAGSVTKHAKNTTRQDIYSQAAIKQKFQELALKIKHARTGLCARIYTEQAITLYKEISYLYKGVLNAEELEQLFYLKTQLEDVIASDIGRDDRYRRSAIKGYARLAESSNPQRKQWAQTRLAELRAVDAYIKLRVARYLLYKTRGSRDTAILKYCDAVVPDPYAKHDMVVEALEMKIAALVRLGLKEDARHQQKLLQTKRRLLRSKPSKK